MSDWIRHDGSQAPTEKQVKVLYKNGMVSAKWLAAKFHSWEWRADAPGYDIAAYKIKPNRKG